MGLLDKAEKSQNNEKALIENVEKSSLDELSNEIYKKISSIKPGVDYGTIIFGILTKTLKISKAVLFFGSEKSFYNLCSTGYDITTNHRLRLDNKFLENNEIRKSLSLKKPFILEKLPEEMKDFFSIREYGLLENVYIIPFWYETRMASILMITEWENFLPENWETFFLAISGIVSTPLSKSRMALLDEDDSFEMNQTANHLDRIKEILAIDSDNGYYLINLDLGTLFSNLFNENSGLTAVHIKKEVLSVFRTMSGGDVDLLELPEDHVLLIQKKERIPNPDLYLFQLSASLPLLYSNLKNPPDLNPRIKLFNNPEDLEAVLEDLL